MEPLSEEFVEKTWQEVVRFSPARADKEMLAMGKNQPDLLAFLMAYTDDLQQELKELVIYFAFVSCYIINAIIIFYYVIIML